VAREQRAVALLAIGHPTRAVAALEHLVVEYPLRERPVYLLMQCLRVSGRQADGLRAFQSFRDRLGEQTGLEPSSVLVAMRDSLYGDDQNASDTDRPLRGYIIHHAIGEGAHGRVYSATQPGTGRPVAIKAIRPEFADSSDFIRRFDTEARLVVRLEHPHIVPLYDYWREPGGAFLVFRLLTGGTAREAAIAQGAFSLGHVNQLVEEVGGALMAAHALGVAHNDVTASNVLLDDSGSSYLTDFGIAIEIDIATDHLAAAATTSAPSAGWSGSCWPDVSHVSGTPVPTSRSPPATWHRASSACCPWFPTGSTPCWRERRRAARGTGRWPNSSWRGGR